MPVGLNGNFGNIYIAFISIWELLSVIQFHLHQTWWHIGIKITSSSGDDNEIHIRQIQDLTQGKTAADRGHFLELDFNELNMGKKKSILKD